MARALIRALDLRKNYHLGGGVVQALRGVSMEIEAGEFIAVMRPSGSGKSTLMYLLGLLDRPSAGSYGPEGQDVAQVRANQRARLRNGKIGFVFQSFNLLARSTALENVELPWSTPALRGRSGDAGRWALATVGLAQRHQHRPSQLSGGEQQRVAIARALVNDPPLILADEPTGALNSRTGLEIFALLQHLNGAGRTVVVVTHDAAVAQHAARIVSMRDGRITSDQPVPARRDAAAELAAPSPAAEEHTGHTNRSASIGSSCEALRAG